MEKNNKKRRITISRSFFKWLLVIVIIAFLASMMFTWIHQTNMSRNSTLSLMSINIWDVNQDVIDASNENLLKLTYRIAQEINEDESVDEADLKRLLDTYDVSEINIIDENGIIDVTTNEEFQYYDMADGEQSAQFL